jgi:DNA-3-methyladenine glycosylase
MYGPPGHAYVFFTFGMHFCVNLVCLGEGTASAVLLRAGEVVEGVETARSRGRAGAAGRGLTREHDGLDVCAPAGPLRILEGAPADPASIRTGPRTGVSTAKDVPWRFYLDAEPTVSPYRAHQPRVRR